MSMPPQKDAAAPIDVDHAICIVVGASPRAEIDHRPMAHRLASRMQEWIDAHGDGDASVLVLTDLWLAGDPELAARPCIALGEADTNAAVAQLSLQLPQALVTEGQYEIRLDPAGDDARACIRGAAASGTAAGVDAFCARMLDGWMRRALGMD